MQLPPRPAGVRLCPRALGQSRKEGAGGGLQCAGIPPALPVGRMTCKLCGTRGGAVSRSRPLVGSSWVGEPSGSQAPGLAPAPAPPPPAPPVCAPPGPRRSKEAGRLPPDPQSCPARCRVNDSPSADLWVRLPHPPQVAAGPPGAGHGLLSCLPWGRWGGFGEEVG